MDEQIAQEVTEVTEVNEMKELITEETFQTLLPGLVEKCKTADVAKEYITKHYEIKDVDGNIIEPIITVAPPAVEEVESIQKEVKKEVKKIMKEYDANTNIHKHTPTPKTQSLNKRFAGKLKAFGNADTAYAFGKMLMANVPDAYIVGDVANFRQREKAIEWCLENGIQKTSQAEGTNSLGGATVFDQVSTDLIYLFQKYGVAASYGFPMTSDVWVGPKQTGNLTVYCPGENTAVTESNPTYANVTVTAKTYSTLACSSRELVEDSVINIADTTAASGVYALAKNFDDCLFSGDSSGTYFGNTGFRKALVDVYTVSGGVGLVKAAGSSGEAWSGLALSDFNNVVGALPDYAEDGAAWFVSKPFFHGVMQNLMTAAGGVTIADISNGVPVYSFLGFPVNIVNSMPTSTAVSQVCALFGNPAMAAAIGIRKGIEVAMSDSHNSAFATNSLYWRVQQRWGYTIHSVGDSSNAGAMVGLVTDAS